MYSYVQLLYANKILKIIWLFPGFGSIVQMSDVNLLVISL
jgi:hypothetical protein